MPALHFSTSSNVPQQDNAIAISTAALLKDSFGSAPVNIEKRRILLR